jgi:hypothetical protein
VPRREDGAAGGCRSSRNGAARGDRSRRAERMAPGFGSVLHRVGWPGYAALGGAPTSRSHSAAPGAGRRRGAALRTVSCTGRTTRCSQVTTALRRGCRANPPTSLLNRFYAWAPKSATASVARCPSVPAPLRPVALAPISASGRGSSGMALSDSHRPKRQRRPRAGARCSLHAETLPPRLENLCAATRRLSTTGPPPDTPLPQWQGSLRPVFSRSTTRGLTLPSSSPRRIGSPSEPAQGRRPGQR